MTGTIGVYIYTRHLTPVPRGIGVWCENHFYYVGKHDTNGKMRMLFQLGNDKREELLITSVITYSMPTVSQVDRCLTLSKVCGNNATCLLGT